MEIGQKVLKKLIAAKLLVKPYLTQKSLLKPKRNGTKNFAKKPTFQKYLVQEKNK